MRHLRRHADGFPNRRMRVNRFANIQCIRAHLDRQRNFANHVAGLGADHAATKNLALLDLDALRARPEFSVMPTQATSDSV